MKVNIGMDSRFPDFYINDAWLDGPGVEIPDEFIHIYHRVVGEYCHIQQELEKYYKEQRDYGT